MDRPHRNVAPRNYFESDDSDLEAGEPVPDDYKMPDLESEDDSGMGGCLSVLPSLHELPARHGAWPEHQLNLLLLLVRYR